MGNLWQPNQTWVGKLLSPSVVLASEGKGCKEDMRRDGVRLKMKTIGREAPLTAVRSSSRLLRVPLLAVVRLKHKQPLSLLIEPEHACTSRKPAVHLPRALRLPSSTGSSNEEERCENAELRSEAVWARAAEAFVGRMGVVGWGLRNPARLSRGTGVTDATVTSPDLTWGFMWFLLEEGEQKIITSTFKTHTHT